MIKHKQLILFLTCSIGYLHLAICQSDIPIGQWRTHFNFQQSYSLASLDGAIFSNTSQALLKIDLSEETFSSLSKTNSLSDAGITALASHRETQSLLVGYSNGNMDVLKENVTYNISSLLNTSKSTSKRINSIFAGSTSFYAATGFGLLEIDIHSLEVITTFEELGRSGQTIAVFDGTVTGDSIFLATEEGILSASLSAGSNLLDFRNWNRVLEEEGSFDYVAAGENITYAAKQEGRLWVNEGSGWQELVVNLPINFLSIQDGELFFGSGNQLIVRSVGGQVNAITLGTNTDIKDALRINGDTWIADGNKGVARVSGQQLNYYSISGPSEKNIFKVRSTDDGIFTLAGGFERNGLLPYNRVASVSKFSAEGWEHEFTSAQWRDASDIASNLQGNFILLYGAGIYDFQKNELIDHTSPGSLLLSSNGFVPVTSLVAYGEDRLVISSNQVGFKYFVRNREGAWEPLSFIPDVVPAAISITQNELGDFYGILPGSGGIIVFNIETREYRIINAGSGLPSSVVNDIAFDRDDYAWLATDNGTAIIANTYEIFDPVDLLLTFPVAGNAFVLDDEVVNAVEVDGANRKWIGTTNGLFILDEYGEGVLTDFNRDNSPLLSDEVTDIAIDSRSGEVFVLTKEGLISYRSQATAPVTTLDQVKIFPNPVRPGFGGVVAIEGLPFDAIVKITDEAGRLVREMVSYGGRATWNLLDWRGNRAASGIYLVFASTRDGSESIVGKMAVIE